MAVAQWTGLPENIGPRNFHPPKRSDLKHWYKAASKVLHDRIPSWEEGLRVKATIDEATIVFEVGSHGTLFIARKQHM